MPNHRSAMPAAHADPGQTLSPRPRSGQKFPERDSARLGVAREFGPLSVEANVHFDLMLANRRRTHQALGLEFSAHRTRRQKSQTVAFDGEALLTAVNGSVLRVEASTTRQYKLDLDAAFLTSDAAALYAASGRTLARIDRASGEVTLFESPADISRLDRLADGCLLVATPASGEPGWLFHTREGRFAFIPGIEVAQ